jgi:hypothetical protein
LSSQTIQQRSLLYYLGLVIGDVSLWVTLVMRSEWLVVAREVRRLVIRVRHGFVKAVQCKDFLYV